MSKIEIINRALLKLGEPMISSLNDVTFGKSYEIIYDDVKALLLSAYPWRFAVNIEKLPLCERKYGDKYVYQLPADCLLLLKVFGCGVKDLTDVRGNVVQGYEVANNTIVTAIKNGISAEYVKNIDDDMRFPPLFREALATKIAGEMVMRVKHSLNIKQALDGEFFALIRQAELNNEIAKDAELVPDNSWVLVREAWRDD